VLPDPDDVGDYLISARSFDEYRAMFALSDAELHGEPVYATPGAELARLVIAETERGTAHTAAGADRYLALIELHRLARGEVRVFPLLDQAGRPLDALVDQLRADLQSIGIASSIRTGDYEFQRGGNQMLVLTSE
jgi:hypothetical protein